MRGKDLYSRAYHSGMIDRPSCYSCQFKGYPRIADVTLADFGGWRKLLKNWIMIRELQLFLSIQKKEKNL